MRADVSRSLGQPQFGVLDPWPTAPFHPLGQEAPPWHWPQSAQLTSLGRLSLRVGPLPTLLQELGCLPSPFPRPLLNGPEESLLSDKQL